MSKMYLRSQVGKGVITYFSDIGRITKDGVITHCSIGVDCNIETFSGLNFGQEGVV